MNTKMKMRLLSLLLCFVMLVGLVPTTVFAWTAPTLSGNGGDAWNIQLSDEGVLSWNTISAATSYDIDVDKTAMGGTVTKIQGVTGTSYNLINRFKELKLENGTYYFQIKANGPNTTSPTISFKYVSPQDKLSEPRNLRWEGTIAKWDSVANATGYEVKLYTDDGYLQLSKTATTTQYDWTTEAADGRWFEVVATADNYRDSNPAEGPKYGTYSWTAPTLTGGKAEWNVQLSDDGMLKWNDMGSATYDIEVDKTATGGTVTNIYSINTNTYNLINRFKTLKLENRTYYFTIKANDTSETSGTISFRYVSPESKLSAPQNLRWDGTVAKWDSVANATGYTVILYTSSGSVQLNKTTSETQYNWDTEAADGRWFKVVATADNYRDSNAAESPKYVVVSYSIGAYPYDATVSQTQAGGQVYLTTDAGTDGWSSDGYIKKATEGTTVTLNANPAPGYKFVEWRQGTAGAAISTDANYQFTASEDKYLYAVFETISSTTYDIELAIFDITYTATDGGTVSIQTNQGSSVAGQSATKSATENTAVTITAVPKQGYEFVAWKKYTPHYSTAFSTEATYTFIAAEPAVIPSDNPPLFLYAVFQETQPQATTYEINCVSHNLSSNETGGTVMLETDKGGTGYAASQQQYATENTTVKLRAVAEPGYQFVAWRKGTPTDANATVSTNTEYQFTATEAVWMYAVFEYTPDCTIECIPFDITGGINSGQNNVGGTVSIQTDKGTASGTTTQSLKATRNSSVTVNAVADSGYEFLGWKKASPYVQDFVSTTASYTFNINEELYLYAVFQEASTPTYNVVITAGTGMSTTGNANQTVGQGSPITSVVYTAADGYYFPTDYSVAAQNGISVTRNSYTQITVSGTPTAAANLTLTNATAKTKETTPSAEFTAESENGGKLTGVDNTMKYSVDGGSNWLDITGDNMAITNVTTANGVQVKKPASDANTKLDSDPKIISVTKATAPTTATGVACTTNSNNDGKLQNVTAAMEYKLSTANNWTDGTGSDITGLANGIYYVRVKASGTVLASDYQTVIVPAYSAVPTYGIDLDVNNTYSFDAVTVGYAAIVAKTVTVINTGNSATGALTVALSGSNANSFELNKTSIGDIAVSGSDTFTVVPKTGLSAGTYTATVTVSGGNSITANFNVSFTVNAASPTYSIALSPSGTQTFTAATVGYGAQTAKTITVNNTGTGATGALTVALSGSNANSFELNKTSIGDIAVSGSDTFTVVPKTGLSAGTYTATVTVSGNNSITASFDVSFTVNAAAPTYSIALSPSGTQTFTAATVGYGAQTAKTITVSNTGTGATGALTVALSGTDAASFTLNKTNIADIAVSGSDTFTVVPKTGLSAGTYTATVTVSGNNSITASFDVSFTVNAATPTYGISISPSGTQTFTAATVGYGAQSAKTITVNNTGTGATGALTVALSGSNASSFTLNKNSIADIAVSGSDTFTVVPKTGLSAGTYTATVTVSGGNSINASFNVSFTVNPAGGGGGNGGGGSYTYYTIKATAGVNGSISPTGNVSVREGRDQTFTITPDKGYAVAKVLIDSKNVGAVKSYTFENVKKNHTIEVVFMKASGNPQTGVFVDVATGSYYEDAVDWAVENGITKGTDDTHFSPDGICTRAQAVTFLWRAAGSPAAKSAVIPFADVKAGSYYYDAVLWAVENGITKGTSETMFSPDATCSRAQIVTFLWRSQKSPAAGTANPFTDVKASAYYADAVLWAVKEDVTKGTTNTTFSPDANCTRAQIVTFIWRALAE